MHYFCWKIVKIAERQIPCLRRLVTLLPDLKPPAAGSFVPRPPLAFVGWELGPQTSGTAPHDEFLATRLAATVLLHGFHSLFLAKLRFATAPPGFSYMVQENIVARGLIVLFYGLFLLFFVFFFAIFGLFFLLPLASSL